MLKVKKPREYTTTESLLYIGKSIASVVLTLGIIIFFVIAITTFFGGLACMAKNYNTVTCTDWCCK